MPLKKGKSKKTVASNIKKGMKEYKETGKTFKGHKPKSKKAAQKQVVAAALASAGKTKKKNLKESVDIAKFISAISTKNYAEANKYLKAVIEDKIMNRINSAVQQPLF